ncbi:hypothetical protein DTO164E3_7687 [Paecilomyces variotii]|nr:hypothetical protein DTO164E3_7687 [Paecilomyces variotii]KAJ9205742.1 hypothetical protein DTO032I3_2298 [Paecilomyces variotii]KAJ9226644.1 hypothetical protein DTO169C6_884 [Paecilomyces variotii]KAJ9271782.1 hypothetical protein DTO212C5_2207 [Paecilomyces variotii]KAJ9282036.1 hypothetical protein DTO021D3_1332 [Paecilomyces variotii]
MPRSPFTRPPEDRGMSPHDIGAAFEGARFGLHADYFSDNPRFTTPGQMPPRSPFPAGSGRFEEMGGGYNHEMSLNETVRKTNLAVALANHYASHQKYSQIHPMMCSDGRFPPDFQVPKTLESMRLLDNTQLDRILLSYHLPLSVREILTFRGASPRDVPPSRIKHAKLQILLEHLGAHRLMAHEMSRHWIREI